jgi:hypothetical protein
MSRNLDDFLYIDQSPTMSDQTERLVRDIARLRSAELVGAPDGVAEVREDLEGMVGSTVSRAVSARLLGVTQTALDRHIDRGAVAVVLTPNGRREVPLTELVRLILALDEVTRSGGESHPLAAVLRARRQRALSIDHATVMPDEPGAGRSSGEIRSLAFHRAVADRLDHQMVVDARRRLRRWTRAGMIDERWAGEWENVLSLPLDGLRRAMTSDDPVGQDLRQSSPFAGALDHEERKRVMDLVPS